MDGGVGWDSSLSLDHVPDNVTWNDTRLGRQIGASAGTLLGAGWIGAGLVNIETGETNSGIAGTAVGIGMIAIARWLRSKD